MRFTGYTLHRWFEHASGLITFPHRWVHSILETCRDSGFLYHAKGKTRRFFMVHLRKGYVKNQLMTRGGDCKQCGVCCNLLFTCPMLTKQRRCLVYGTCRPKACKVFPIDQRDIEEVRFNGGHCGYTFPTLPT